jgi:hypothetical protein
MLVKELRERCRPLPKKKERNIFFCGKVRGPPKTKEVGVDPKSIKRTQVN